jgi:hypothetical protein
MIAFLLPSRRGHAIARAVKIEMRRAVFVIWDFRVERFRSC